MTLARYKKPDAERSRTMAAVKGVNTSPELRVRRIVHALGFRFGLHGGDLPGKPDIVLRRLRAVVFVHGCFWHGHDCARGARMPKTNRAYWAAKIERNKRRDRALLRALKTLGWRAVVVWECALKDETRLRRRLARVLGA